MHGQDINTSSFECSNSKSSGALALGRPNWWQDILPKDTLPKDILPKDILPTDVLPNGHFAEWTEK
jgi:hypothetical protein